MEGVRGFLAVCILATAFSTAASAAELASGHVVESFVPALAFNHDCQSHVILTNLGDAAVKLEVEGHASGGGLVPLLGRRNRTWINPGETLEYTPEIMGETDGAWFRIRENVPSPGDPAVVAVRASVGCLSGNVLVNTTREVAFPMRNPWFAGSAVEWTGVELWAVNVSPSIRRAPTPAIRMAPTTSCRRKAATRGFLHSRSRFVLIPTMSRWPPGRRIASLSNAVAARSSR